MADWTTGFNSGENGWHVTTFGCIQTSIAACGLGSCNAFPTPPPAVPSPTAEPTSSTVPSPTSSAGQVGSPESDMSTVYIGAGIGAAVLIICCILIIVLVTVRRRRRDQRSVDKQLDIALENTTYQSIAPLGSASTKHQYGDSSAVPASSTNNRQSQLLTSKTPTNVVQYADLTLQDKVGAGAFGEVFKGKWRGAPVAIKKLFNTLDAKKVQDFVQEAQVMASIQPHPNVVQFLGLCESPLCLVTEFCELGSLLTYIRQNKVGHDQQVSIASGIVAGMAHLHTEGLIHRDLAARNILLDSKLTVKISDFGYSRLLDVSNTNQTDVSAMTKSDVGPLKWMAPECLLHREYSFKTDVWSFGVLLFELMTTKEPYPDIDVVQAAAQVSTGRANLLTYLYETSLYSPLLLDLVGKCLAADAANRPTFKEMLSRFP